MFKKKFLVVLALVAFAVIASKAYAELALVTESLGVQDVQEINNMTPGSSKTFLGTRLQGPLQAGTTTAAACNTSGIACNTVATTVTTAAYVKTSSSAMGNSIALSDGYQNQEITFVLATDGGKDFYVTPTTKTGFTSVQLNDANDSATLKFIDSTTGWVIKGNNGATIN